MEVRTYIWGQDRNEPHLAAHAYECEPGDMTAPIGAMCWRGWNRSGVGFSIFRGVVTGGVCAVCAKRRSMNLPAVRPKARKTRWM